MLATPRELLERRRRVLAECKAQQLGQEETGKRLLEVEPDSPVGLLALGTARLTDGDFDAAEPLLWRALEGAPSNPGYYFPLLGLYRERSDDALASRLAALTFWKLSFYDEIPKNLAAAVGKCVPHLGEAAQDPAAYRQLAETWDLEAQPWPERLIPYRLLNDVQRQGEVGLEPELLAEIREHAARCLPVFQSAIREGNDSDASTLWAEAEAMLLALLGEIGGPELMGDLLLTPPDEPDAFYHAQWSVWRLGQRFPAEAFERLSEAAKDADAGVRATIAQQLYFLPSAPGARAAILGLLDGFPALAQDEEAWYLLKTVSTLLSMKGSAGDSAAVLKRWERHLSKEGRRLLNDARESGDGLLPDLIGMGIDEVDIEAVCCDHALMEEHEDEDFPLDEDEEDDYIEPARIEKPGRNDPCWCGSGKKYKKCHLQSDEESARTESADERLVEGVWRQALKFAGRFHGADEVDRALRMYFDRDPSSLNPRVVGDSGYAVWYLFEYRAAPEAPTAAEEFLSRRGGQLAERARAFLTSLLECRLGLWEIRRVQGGRGVEVEDAFGGGSLFVDAPATAETSESGEFVVARIHRFEQKWRFAGDEMVVSPELAGRLREEVERGSAAAGVARAEWFRSQSHEWWRFIVETAAELE